MTTSRFSASPRETNSAEPRQARPTSRRSTRRRSARTPFRRSRDGVTFGSGPRRSTRGIPPTTCRARRPRRCPEDPRQRVTTAVDWRPTGSCRLSKQDGAPANVARAFHDSPKDDVADRVGRGIDRGSRLGSGSAAGCRSVEAADRAEGAGGRRASACSRLRSPRRRAAPCGTPRGGSGGRAQEFGPHRDSINVPSAAVTSKSWGRSGNPSGHTKSTRVPGRACSSMTRVVEGRSDRLDGDVVALDQARTRRPDEEADVTVGVGGSCCWCGRSAVPPLVECAPWIRRWRPDASPTTRTEISDSCDERSSGHSVAAPASTRRG
jgi:hypothetical protein